jgi:hypothetical protein
MIAVFERAKTVHALDCAATVIGELYHGTLIFVQPAMLNKNQSAAVSKEDVCYTLCYVRCWIIKSRMREKWCITRIVNIIYVKMLIGKAK